MIFKLYLFIYSFDATVNSFSSKLNPTIYFEDPPKTTSYKSGTLRFRLPETSVQSVNSYISSALSVSRLTTSGTVGPLTSGRISDMLKFVIINLCRHRIGLCKVVKVR